MTKQLTTIRIVNVVFILIIIGLLNVTTAFAKAADDASLQGGTIAQTKTQENQITLDQKAKMWGLTKDDYQQYLQEMVNTPSNHWWKDIDPPQVLGMNAKTEEERMKYASIDVKLDQEKTSKEIAFQHAYSKAFANAYPNAKTININTNRRVQNGAVQSSDRFYLFTPLNDSEGSMLVGRIIQMMRGKSNVLLNIFFVGKTPFAGIQRWAEGNNIPKSMSHGDQVTLNHNEKGRSNMLQQILKTTKVTLPVLLRVRNGHSEIMTLTSL